MAATKAEPRSNGKAPERVIDLDAARAARGEKHPVTLRFMGEEWEMPGEVSFEFAEAAAKEDIRGAMVVVLGDRAEAFFALKPSVDDIMAFIETALKVYGLDEGKVPASSGS